MANTYVDVVTKRVDVNGTSFVYRETGEKEWHSDRPAHHLTAVLRRLGPRTIDSLAQRTPRSSPSITVESEAPRALRRHIDDMARMQWLSFEL